MLVYLKPLSIFPELHSDTLFGAITYAISELYPDKVDEMISEFENIPPFIISSTFPFAYNKDKKIKFYPKIIFSKSSNNQEYNPKTFKEYKKVKFFEEEIFFDLINGTLSEEEILNNFKTYTKLKGLLMKEDYGMNFNYGENIIPNNSVNRISNETEGIFYSEGNEFKNLGLFFLVDFNNECYKPLVKAAIKFLKDKGFGKDISTGKGQFDYEIDENYSFEYGYDLSSEKLMNYFVTLSRFIPTNNDLKFIGDSSSYELGSKRGRSSSNEIRKEVKFFKEGSMFPCSKKFYGQIVKSGKVSPAVEYGFAFPLRCTGSDGGN